MQRPEAERWVATSLELLPSLTKRLAGMDGARILALAAATAKELKREASSLGLERACRDDSVAHPDPVS